MSVVRAFIAIEMPQTVKDRLMAQQQDMKLAMGELPVRWVPEENLHLTLKFLGDISESSVESVGNMLGSACSHYAPMEISIGGIGIFPNLLNPRVIWVGVETPDELLHLYERIEGDLERLGYPREPREFSPHLTLGRVGRKIARREIDQIKAAMQAHQVGFLAAAVISEIALFKSV